MEAAGRCAPACYEAKTVAYQKCRSIPPTNRSERVRCFRAADEALDRCLGGCPK